MIPDPWTRWVDYWREREPPEAYALARMVWGLAMVAWLLHQALWPGLLELYAIPEDGGIFPFVGRPPYSLFRFLDPTAGVVWALWGVALTAAVGLTVGFLTRGMAVVLQLCTMTMTSRLGMFYFGADAVVTVFGFLMCLAPLGAAYSVDARLWGRRETVPRWPRRLIIAQLTLLYVKTGLVKVGATWSLSGGYSALYYALNDPGFARFSGVWAARLYPLTQVGAFVARWWETLFFVLPINMHLRSHPVADAGRLRRWLAAVDLRPWMLGTGIVLHLSLAATMRLGMFSWVTLSLYPFFLEPHEARWLLSRAGWGPGPSS